MQTILATGGTGFIGSHTCIELLKKGFKVIIFDSLINSSKRVLDQIVKISFNGKTDFSKNCSFVLGDIRDLDLLESIFSEEYKNKNEIDAVIHFSGLKSISESFLNPIEYWDVNVGGTINLLKVMNKFSCNNLVFSSSATIYAPETESPIKEYDSIRAINPYGKSKQAIESILDDFYFSKNKNFSIASLRYFNPIGAHNSGLIGEDPNSIPNNIFPLINKVAIGELDEIKIFGNDWETPDGSGIRDYIHIMDLAEGHFKALDYLFKNSPVNIKLNLGTGRGLSVIELIETFKKVNNIRVPFSFSKRRPGDRGIYYADNSLAKELLRWEPSRTIEDMCRDGWKWQRNRSNIK